MPRRGHGCGHHEPAVVRREDEQGAMGNFEKATRTMIVVDDVLCLVQIAYCGLGESSGYPR